MQSPATSDQLLKFQWSLQALAQGPTMQRALFPDFVCVADELALDFDEHVSLVSGAGLLSSFAPEQLALIDALNAKLTSMSGSEHADLWTDQALEASAEWAEVRAMAKATLDKLSWPKTAPPIERGAVYVGAR